MDGRPRRDPLPRRPFVGGLGGRGIRERRRCGLSRLRRGAGWRRDGLGERRAGGGGHADAGLRLQCRLCGERSGFLLDGGDRSSRRGDGHELSRGVALRVRRYRDAGAHDDRLVGRSGCGDRVLHRHLRGLQRVHVALGRARRRRPRRAFGGGEPRHVDRPRRRGDGSRL